MGLDNFLLSPLGGLSLYPAGGSLIKEVVTRVGVFVVWWEYALRGIVRDSRVVVCGYSRFVRVEDNMSGGCWGDDII